MTDYNTIEEMKAQVAERMRVADRKAVIWSKHLFGDNGYPIITDADGKNQPVCGLYVSPDKTLLAIIHMPEGLSVHGVLVVTHDSKHGIPAPEDVTAAGTDSEWAVLCNCYDTANQMLRAQALDSAPLPWW